MVLMFARMHEAIDALRESLKSRGIWSDDDERAFFHVAHDQAHVAQQILQAFHDYTTIARNLRLETGLDNPPKAPPAS